MNRARLTRKPDFIGLSRMLAVPGIRAAIYILAVTPSRLARCIDPACAASGSEGRRSQHARLPAPTVPAAGSNEPPLSAAQPSERRARFLQLLSTVRFGEPSSGHSFVHERLAATSAGVRVGLEPSIVYARPRGL